MIDSGDTAWVLTCSALVLLMTPGLALFYGGLARSKNAAATIMHSFMTIGIAGVVWVLWGYTIAFGPDIGGSSETYRGSAWTASRLTNPGRTRTRSPTRPS